MTEPTSPTFGRYRVQSLYERTGYNLGQENQDPATAFDMLLDSPLMNTIPQDPPPPLNLLINGAAGSKKSRCSQLCNRIAACWQKCWAKVCCKK